MNQAQASVARTLLSATNPGTICPKRTDSFHPYVGADAPSLPAEKSLAAPTNPAASIEIGDTLVGNTANPERNLDWC